jgi:hypothetical protein
VKKTGMRIRVEGGIVEEAQCPNDSKQIFVLKDIQYKVTSVIPKPTCYEDQWQLAFTARSGTPTSRER